MKPDAKQILAAACILAGIGALAPLADPDSPWVFATASALGGRARQSALLTRAVDYARRGQEHAARLAVRLASEYSPGDTITIRTMLAAKVST